MVKVKGTTPDEKKVVKAAKKAASKRTVRAEDTPEAKPTPKAKQAAAEDQFAKADAAVVGNPDDPGEFRLRMAALGGL